MVTVVRSPRIRRVPGLRPSSGCPPGAAACTVAWPRAARGRRGSGGAGDPGGAQLLRALSGSAPPSRAGTARSDVSAAHPPPPPCFTRTSAEWRGGGWRRGAPCPETRPCLPAPSLRPSNPSRKWPAPPGSLRATNHLGSGDKPRAGNVAGSSRIQDARGRMESRGLEGHPRSGRKGGF